VLFILQNAKTIHLKSLNHAFCKCRIENRLFSTRKKIYPFVLIDILKIGILFAMNLLTFNTHGALN